MSFQVFLHTAAQLNNVEVAQALIEDGVDINATDVCVCVWIYGCVRMYGCVCVWIYGCGRVMYVCDYDVCV